MARKLTPQQERFKAAANACIKVAESWPAYGRCMKDHMPKKRRRSKGRRKGRR
jgi:hypothetical protein